MPLACALLSLFAICACSNCVLNDAAMFRALCFESVVLNFPFLLEDLDHFIDIVRLKWAGCWENLRLVWHFSEDFRHEESSGAVFHFRKFGRFDCALNFLLPNFEPNWKILKAALLEGVFSSKDLRFWKAFVGKVVWDAIVEVFGLSFAGTIARGAEVEFFFRAWFVVIGLF